jgi:hypothetical protein
MKKAISLVSLWLIVTGAVNWAITNLEQLPVPDVARNNVRATTAAVAVALLLIWLSQQHIIVMLAGLLGLAALAAVLVIEFKPALEAQLVFPWFAPASGSNFMTLTANLAGWGLLLVVLPVRLLRAWVRLTLLGWARNTLVGT